MSQLQRALQALAGLEALAEERREKIAGLILAIIEEHAGGADLTLEELEALEAELRLDDRIASDEEVETLFRNLLR
jgi:hypothetical protein